MSLIFGAGIVAWLLVVGNFVFAFRRRRSSVRVVFIVMAGGWPVLLARELHLLQRTLALALILLGICAGFWCAAVLVSRWLNDPSVLD